MTDQITSRLTAYVNEQLRPEGSTTQVTADTPLLQSGILDSLKTAMLLNFIRTEFAVSVPSQAIEFHNFENLHRVGALVARLLDSAEVRDADAA